MNELRDAAARAAVFSVIEQKAKQLKNAARAELQALEVGDVVAGKVGGQIVGKASWTAGKTTLTVTDEEKLLEFVREKRPSELVQSVNSAYLKALEARAKQVGEVIDSMGELVPGVELRTGDSYITVRCSDDAEETVASMLRQGLVELVGLRDTAAELEPADWPQP